MADIRIKSFDGAEFDAYLAKPQSGKGAAVVVIQEIFGVNRSRACSSPTTDASVGYYPVQIDQHLDNARIAKVTVHSYAGVDHAFAREGGQNYDAQAASEANRRTAEFFRIHL